MAESSLNEAERPKSRGEKKAEKRAAVEKEMVGLGDLSRMWGTKNWTALSKEKLPVLKAFAVDAKLNVTGCTKKDDFVRVIAAAMEITKPGAPAASSSATVPATSGSAHSVVVTETPTGAPAPAAPASVEYDGNPGIDSQVVASLQPDAQRSSKDWESGTADDALLAELLEDIRVDAGELLNSYEAEDGEEEELLLEVDEDKEQGTPWLSANADEALIVRLREAVSRPGAISTDRHCAKMIERFTTLALSTGLVRDSFVDEQFITEFLKHNAQRERMTPQGVPISGTRVGSAQLRKLFFGALRYRIQQAATIAEFSAQKDQRPAASRQLTKYLKALMHQAVVNLRMGETEGEDAQDVQAGTILDRLTSEEEERLGSGFLAHSNRA
ncbi:hypothetical protein QFC20_004007 [Naganishia adeliensis]|uniref:Uncharacterized protein n=1 Tax=Naganishia adeliensis TaxID=92952 RepID=A0ACC2W730_9TREE|nr:hypothetical protein QFC20_004007 [Naganishia adeliensis]